MKGLNWLDLEIGKEYKYEEKYELQAIVLILEKEILNDYINIKMKVLNNVYDCEEKIMSVGKTLDEKYSYLMSGCKFKNLNDEFDYFVIE